jgi:hypothetical protein
MENGLLSLLLFRNPQWAARSRPGQLSNSEQELQEFTSNDHSVPLLAGRQAVASPIGSFC